MIKETVKGISWKDHILSIQPGSYEMFPLEKRNYLATLISSIIKLKHPERKYTLDATSLPRVLKIHRDKED